MLDLDRVKVIKGLEEAYRVIEDYVPSCYRGYSRLACCDAIDLLREQEPVEPKWRKGYAYCSQCGYKLHWIADRNNFCQNCGRAVKWE